MTSASCAGCDQRHSRGQRKIHGLGKYRNEDCQISVMCNQRDKVGHKAKVTL